MRAFWWLLKVTIWTFGFCAAPFVIWVDFQQGRTALAVLELVCLPIALYWAFLTMIKPTLDETPE